MEARTTGEHVPDRPPFRGMGLTSPFQIAMAKYLFDEDEEVLDPKWYEEDGKSYSVHKNNIR